MIKELSEALATLINSLSMKPFTTIVAIFVICTGYIGYKNYDTLQNLIITPKEEARRFKQQLESAALVNSAINNLKEDTKAHSVVIKQFHNGRHDLTGIPFTAATTTFYTVGIQSETLEEPVSSMNTSLRIVWERIDKPTCVIFDNAVDSSTVLYMRTYNLKGVIVCPLTNLLNYPIGTMTIGFSDKETLSEEDLNKSYSVARSVTGYLQDGS